MMSPEGFQELVDALLARGLSKEKAEDYAERLGDTIEVDEGGRWVIRGDDGSVLDRIEPIE